MSLSRVFYEPFYSLADFDHLFDEAFNTRVVGQSQNSSAATKGKGLRPRMDLHENSGNNTVTATFELPGLKKEDIDISVQNNTLTVSGETQLSNERNEEGYTVRERRHGKFSRTLPLPQGTQPETIKASMEDGVLKVTFPKVTPEAERQKITVS